MKLLETRLSFAKSQLARLGKAMLAAMMVVCLSWMALPAQATPLLKVGTPNLVATGSQAAGAVEKSRAEREVDRMWGEGSHESVEGKVQETLGGAKRRIGNITGDTDTEVRGAGDEIKGRTQYNTGKAKSTLEDAQENVEEGAQGIIDNVKDFFR